MAIFQNAPLWLGIFAICFAQFLKVPIYFIATKKIDWSYLTTTGGMPSSHSAAVMAVTTAIGFETSFDSPVFAVAAMMAGIVMYDATGIRFQAGKHATLLNEMRNDMNAFFVEIKRWPELNPDEKREELKTLLGHKKSEVFFGALTGIFVSVVYYIIVQ